MTLTQTDLELRRGGVTGSDIAAILGLHPYRSPLDVYLDKLQLTSEVEETAAMRLGRKLEPVLASEYEEQTGTRLESPIPTLLVHPERPWHRGSPDRFVAKTMKGVELKTAGLRQAAQWGDPQKEDECEKVPTHYYLQCAWYMALAEFPAWDLAVLLGGQEFRVYSFRRDRDLEQILLTKAEDFWRRHVLAQDPPPLDGSARTSAWLQERFPRHDVDLIPAPPELAPVAIEIAQVREALARLDTVKSTLENRIKAAIGARAGLLGDGWQATWKQTKDGTKIDWKRLEAEQPDLVAPYRLTTPGVRRFLFTWIGKETSHDHKS